jgi:hypothetical protein
MAPLKADWDTWQAWAARPKWRCSARAEKLRSWRVLGRFTGISRGLGTIDYTDYRHPNNRLPLRTREA